MKQAPLSSRGDEPSVPEHVVENLTVFQNWRPSFYRLCRFAILSPLGSDWEAAITIVTSVNRAGDAAIAGREAVENGVGRHAGIKLQFPRSPLIVPIHVVGFEMQVRHKLSRERRSFGKRLCFFVFVR